MRVETNEVVNRMLRDVVGFFREFNEPLKLRVLGQRYGKMLKGIEIITLLQDDPRFVIKTLENGGRTVFPRGEFESVVRETIESTGLPEYKVVGNLYKAYGLKQV